MKKITEIGAHNGTDKGDDAQSSPSYEELAQRNSMLLKAQANLKKELLEKQRTISTFLRTLDTKEEEICGLQVELTESKLRSKLLRRSLNQFKEMSARDKTAFLATIELEVDVSNVEQNVEQTENSMIKSMRRKVDSLRPKMAAISELAHTDIGELLTKQKVVEDDLAPESESETIRWRSAGRALPLKTGLYLVTNGSKTELAYFDVTKGAFAVTAIEAKYWTDAKTASNKFPQTSGKAQ